MKVRIRDHIESAIANSIEGFPSASEDEDTMTGHFGGRLRIGVQHVDVVDQEISGQWSWSIDYKKFRGRGPGSTESVLGADGILELTLQRPGRTETKSVLFQAKMDGGNIGDLFGQCVKLSTWREASFVLNYTETQFQASLIDDVITHRRIQSTEELGRFLGHSFLDCHTGDTNLRYDATRRLLIWRDMRGITVATAFSIPHRIRIRVRPPRRSDHSSVDQMVSHEDVYKHRMSVSAEELLAYGHSRPLDSKSDITSARNLLAKTYHPDKHQADKLINEILTQRMQELNRAAVEAGKKRQA